MKYPQLVSTRAVNAISDWLVSRLEQLGVEAPLIYSRLLLSLLQSSVQINDPIEFSNLETFLANRKGNSKRYPSCDTDTLRKITAVQCLMEIVSSEQEITKIESLVDELCEKLIEIEKQSSSLEEDDDLQIAASALNSVLKTTTSSSLNYNATNGAPSITATNKKLDGEGSKIKQFENKTTQVTRKSKQQIIPDVEDPCKRYYRAFPALSKEMEDSIGLLRRNTKLLTWPVDRKINSTNKIVKNLQESVDKTASESLTEQPSKTCVSLKGTSTCLDNSKGGEGNTVLCNTAGVKRKSKRRRNQASSKGKTTAGNNIRKTSYCGGSSSPTWDTDFEGSWEMGRDLIKEFIVKQNNRNRSTSESGAYNMAIGGCSNSIGSSNSNAMHEKRMKSMMNDAKIKQEPMADEQDHEQLLQRQQQQIIIPNNDQVSELLADPCVVEVSFCDNIVENSKSDDTLASVSEITEGSLSTARRLYERDISNDSIYDQTNQQSSSSSSEQLDFAQFKAKFNSSVEALWKNSTSNKSVGQTNQSMMQSSIVSDSAVSVVPCRSEDLKNFWTNYYSHRYDVDNSKEHNYSECYGDYSMPIAGNPTQSDMHSDYFSMPTISSSCNGVVGTCTDDFDKSVGGKRAGGKSSPIGVFLQNSIWSENSNASHADTDESFFKKILNSTSSIQKQQDQQKMDIPGNEKSFYYPYQASKWSEGINGVPQGSASNQYIQQQEYQQQSLKITSSSSSSSISTLDHSARSCYTNDITDSTPPSSSSYLGANANWQNPTGNDLQADIKSWNSSNPTSLTELYGGGFVATASLGKKNSCNFDRNAGNEPVITLANHSETSSGFLAYSRIKPLINAKSISKWQKPGPSYVFRTSTTPPDDENLLHSEWTHFRPINMSFADGHTFEISSELDTVDFERSESGYLYLDSEKYLDYTRTDTLAEDDASVSAHYPGSSSLSHDRSLSVASTKSSQSTEFMIRFRVRSTDKACQTESNVITPNVLRSSLFNKLASTQAPKIVRQTPRNENGYNDEDDWMDIGCTGSVSGGCNARDDDECVSIDQWSMVEITKKCVDSNNSSHTLWGMCSACNNDMKPIPANRMLKAELNVEGDEIMSDLRYMQDLYIGSDYEDQNGVIEGIGGGEDDDDTDLDAETIRDCEFYQAMATPACCNEMEEEDQQHKEILYNVNKLIADLLRPENAQSLANALGAVGVGCVTTGDVDGGGNGCFEVTCGAQNGADKTNEMNEGKYIGGLWNSHENKIWKNKLNPIGIFSSLNNNNNGNGNINNETFLDKLSWNHSNLAEIWGKTSPEKATKNNNPSMINTGTEELENTEEEENIKIACKNMKNLLKSNTIMSPNENSTALFNINENRLNDCKRLLFNSNKFKISNRIDRKRRHSASQNVFSINNNNSSIHNNNNCSAYDNNNTKFCITDSTVTDPPSAITPNTAISNTTTTNATTTQTNATIKDTLSEYGRNILPCNDNNNDESQEEQFIDDIMDNNPRATIISCKYWTTMQPIISGNVIEGEISDQTQTTAETFFIDKNSQFFDGLPSITLNTSSILKHVTLVSRPLTR